MMIGEMKIDIRNSKVLEAVGLIHILTECNHHEFQSDDIQVFSYLKDRHISILNILKGFYMRGLELFEFMLKIKDYNNIPYYIKECDKYNDTEYIYILLDFKDDIEIIHSIKDGKIGLEEVFTSQGIMETTDYLNSLEYLISNTQDFREKVNKLFSDIDQDENFHRIIDQFESRYEEVIIGVKQELEKRHPLSFAQDYMGKHFYNIEDFRYYAFIPTYFVSPHILRYMDKKGQILIMRLMEKEYDLSEKKKNVENFMKLLSDHNRLEILRLLNKRPMYGKELSEHLNIKTPTVSHHIEHLRKLGLIHIERDKNIKYFSLNTKNFNRLIKELKKYILYS